MAPVVVFFLFSFPTQKTRIGKNSASFLSFTTEPWFPE
jgi:hypothetical protein